MTIQLPIDELVSSFKKLIDRFVAEFTYDHVKHDVGLKLLKIPDKLQNNKLGTSFMKKLTEILDAHSYNAKTVASNKYGSKIKRLVHFYEQHGFRRKYKIKNADKNLREHLMERIFVSKQ